MSKGPLFKRAWEDLYKGIVEYRPGQKAVGIDPGGMAVKLEVDSVRGGVLNVVPPHPGGDIAGKTGLITHNNPWGGRDWPAAQSQAVEGLDLARGLALSGSLMS